MNYPDATVMQPGAAAIKVPYTRSRSNIRSGDLLAWGHEAWRSWHDLEVQAVRMFTRSEYAHVGVAWRMAGRVWVIEAVVPNIRVFPLSRLLPCYWLGGEKRNAWTKEIEESVTKIIGQEYSKLEAISSFLGKVVPGANEKWQCAETAAYLRAALTLGDYGSPTPTTLVKATLREGASLRLLEETP